MPEASFHASERWGIAYTSAGDYDPPVLSIVTGTVDRQTSFERLLASIVRNTPPVPWELIVADGSTARYSTQLPNNVVMLSDGGRPGFSKAMNIACRAARGTYVAWLNDDVEVQPGWAAAAVHFMDTHPQGGVGAFYWCDHKPPWKVERCWGILYANFGILRRRLGDEIGWFDETVEMYGADTDLCLRILDRGLPILPIEGSRILHHRHEDQFRKENEARVKAKSGIEALQKRWEKDLPRLAAVSRRLPADAHRRQEKAVVKLHIGCGTIYLEGFVNVDMRRPGMHLAVDRPDLVRIHRTVETDYYGHARHMTVETCGAPGPRKEGVCDVFSDIRDLANIYSDSANEILARQVFEHLSLQEARRALAAFKRVLAPTGLLRIDVPDHEGTVAKLMESHDPFYFRHLYGTRRDEYGYHLMSYSKEGMMKLASDAGYIYQEEEPNIHFYPAFCLRFKKPERPKP